MCVCVCVCVLLNAFNNAYHGRFVIKKNCFTHTKEATKAPIASEQKIQFNMRCVLHLDPYTGVGSGGGGGGGGQGGHVPPTFLIGGGNGVCAPPLLTPHFYFPLELYVYITLTNNYLAFFIYQLIILWTITIHPNTTRLYWFFTEGTKITCLCAPPPPHTHFLAHCYATAIQY